jgi:hypothetical protein
MALCLPAKFQVFIVVVNVLVVLYSVEGVFALLPSLIFTGFFGYIWVIFLNCMCNNGYRWLSWLLIAFGLAANILMWIALYTFKKGGGKLAYNALPTSSAPAEGTAAPAAPDTAAATAGATTSPAVPAAAGGTGAAGTAPAKNAPPLAAPVSTSVKTVPAPAATNSSLVK